MLPNFDLDYFYLSVPNPTQYTVILPDRTHKLKVRGLTIQIAKHRKEIMKVLPFLDSKFLKELYIFTTPNDKNKVLEMDEILKLDHLNNFESFEISKCIIPDNCVTKLAHVPYNDIRVDSINSKDLLFLKDVILRLPTFRIFDISFQNFPDLIEFVEATGTWKTGTTLSPEKFEIMTYLQMEDIDSILEITFSTLYGNNITFETKSRQFATSSGPIVIQ